jgi:phage-related protein
MGENRALDPMFSLMITSERIKLMKVPGTYKVYSGRTFEVEFYFNAQGKSPAYDYYQELSDDVKRRLLVILGHFADAPFGTILPKAIMNIEDKEAGVYAFKPSIHRFFSFFAKGRKIILLNAYQKHSQKMTRLDREALASAIRMKEDYERRAKSGEYYE